MNYYKRHIGDYAKKAGHLSPLEHGVYTLLLDAYYDREQAPTEAEAMRWARARNPDETQAVATVLREFFKEHEGRYIQQRVEEELESARAIAERNRNNGKLGGRRPRARKTQPVKSGLPKERQSTNPLIHNKEEKTARKRATPKCDFQTFIDACQAAGELPIPADDPIYAYAESIGLPDDFLALAWGWFKAKRAGAMQAGVPGWRAHFRDAVKGNWPKFWYPAADGSWALTTAGEQARRASA